MTIYGECSANINYFDIGRDALLSYWGRVVRRDGNPRYFLSDIAIEICKGKMDTFTQGLKRGEDGEISYGGLHAVVTRAGACAVHLCFHKEELDEVLHRLTRILLRGWGSNKGMVDVFVIPMQFCKKFGCVPFHDETKILSDPAVEGRLIERSHVFFERKKKRPVSLEDIIVPIVNNVSSSPLIGETNDVGKVNFPVSPVERTLPSFFGQIHPGQYLANGGMRVDYKPPPGGFPLPNINGTAYVGRRLGPSPPVFNGDICLEGKTPYDVLLRYAENNHLIFDYSVSRLPGAFRVDVKFAHRTYDHTAPHVKEALDNLMASILVHMRTLGVIRPKCSCCAFKTPSLL